MKILYCIYQIGVGGGVERVLVAKANYLKQKGHDVRIITCCPALQPSPYGLDPTIPVESFDIDYASEFKKPLLSRFFITIKKMWKHARLVKQYLRHNPVDIVVTTHAYEMAFLPFLRDGSKKVLELHASQMMYQMQRRDRKDFGTKWLVRMLNWRDRLVNYCFDAVGCLTHEDYELRGKPRNMHVIPNPSPFYPNKRSHCEQQIVLALGRHSVEKNFAELVDIWAMVVREFPTWRLQIVGEGPLKGNLQNKLDSLGLGQSVCLEPATADPRLYYQNAAIYVMTSLYEGMPMTLIEAQSYGLPIVSYACPCGPRDIVVEGTGFLVSPGDKLTYANRLKELMSNLLLRRNLGSCAFQASERFQMEDIGEQWIELFEKLRRT